MACKQITFDRPSDSLNLTLDVIPGSLSDNFSNDDRGGGVLPNARAGESRDGTIQVLGIPNAASNLAVSGTSTTVVLDAADTEADDFYNGMAIIIMDGVGRMQHRLISDYDNASNTATVSNAFVEDPDSTSEYIIGAGGQGNTAFGGISLAMALLLESPVCAVGETDITGDAVAFDSLITIGAEGDSSEIINIGWEGTIDTP